MPTLAPPLFKITMFILASAAISSCNCNLPWGWKHRAWTTITSSALIESSNVCYFNMRMIHKIFLSPLFNADRSIHLDVPTNDWGNPNLTLSTSLYLPLLLESMLEFIALHCWRNNWALCFQVSPYRQRQRQQRQQQHQCLSDEKTFEISRSISETGYWVAILFDTYFLSQENRFDQVQQYFVEGSEL